MTGTRKLTLPEVIQYMGMTEEETARQLDCPVQIVRSKIKGESDWTATDLKILLGVSGLDLDRISI